MNAQLVPLMSAAIVFVAVLAVITAVVDWRSRLAKNRSLAFVSAYASGQRTATVVRKPQRESALRGPLLALGARLVPPSSRAKLQRRLVLAGDPMVDAVDSAVVRKVVYLLVGIAVGLFFGLAAGGLAWLMLPGMAMLGFYLPNILAYNTGIKREDEIRLGLPDALDMLNLCVESGLSFQAALSQVATNQSGPVAEEFALVLQEMQYGRSRGQAMAALSERTNQEDMQRFVSAMLQVDKLGVPVATVLREQAKEMRAKRFARAREQAQKVPVKILAPLMLCFLPALFIIILAPAVSQLASVFSSL